MCTGREREFEPYIEDSYYSVRDSRNSSAISVERKKHLGKHCGTRSKRSSKEEGGYKNRARGDRWRVARISATIH